MTTQKALPKTKISKKQQKKGTGSPFLSSVVKLFFVSVKSNFIYEIADIDGLDKIVVPNAMHLSMSS